RHGGDRGREAVRVRLPRLPDEAARRNGRTDALVRGAAARLSPPGRQLAGARPGARPLTNAAAARTGARPFTKGPGTAARARFPPGQTPRSARALAPYRRRTAR